jgi:D-glycero-D-manno-heptose 1,7-bisphosphate phosphatase
MTEQRKRDRTPQAVAFLDRDGVLNVDTGYVHRPGDLEWIDGAPEAVGLLNQAGYRVIVITNQSGIARGFYDEEAVRLFHAHMQDRLAEHGAYIDAFYYCPHHPEGRVPQFAVACDCRKPKTGLLKQAERDFPVDKGRSFLVGDKDLNDIGRGELIVNPIVDPELHAEFVVIQPTRRNLSPQARMFLQRFEQEVAYIHDVWDESIAQPSQRKASA